MEDNLGELERILQEGIFTYAGVEPLSGLDERVMARVRMAKRPRTNMAGWWAALVLGAAALMVISVYLRMGGTQTRPAILPEVRTAIVAKVPEPIETMRISTQRPRRHRVAPLPKQRIFPTPFPLTAQELRLLAMAKQDPEGTAQTFNSLQKRASEPVEIVPLVIPPLETGGGQ
jgi:hypothetical protein